MSKGVATIPPVPDQNHVFRDFAGINTQAKRQAIQQNEFSWLENLMPVGHGNLVTVPACSAALAVVASGMCYYMHDYNLNNANYMFMATNTGRAYQVALASPYTRTLIGAAFSNAGLEIAQWKNERIMIADPVNGLYSWDGTLLTGPGALVSITITNPGAAYTAIPTISFTGGGGTGATAVAHMELAGAQTVSAIGTGYTPGDIATLVGGTFSTVGKVAVATVKLASAAINAAGTGYVIADTITLAGGTFSVAAVLTVATVNGGGGVLTFTITNRGNYTVKTAAFTQGSTSGIGVGATFQNGLWGVNSVSVYQAGDYSVLPAAAVATTGGGTGFTITPAYDVLSAVVTSGGTVPYAAPPTVVFSSGAAAGTAVLMDVLNAEHVATFSDRVWVSYRRTISFTAPNSYFDTNPANSAGSFIVTDATLHSNITQLISANQFLYFTGVDSVNVIGDVSVNSDGVTIFSNTNLTASVGTEFSYTLIPYFRSIWLANKSGVYAISGSTPQKMSDPLDGIMRLTNFTVAPSGGTVMLENILCTAFLFQYNDNSLERPLLALFFNKKWFVASQGDDLTLIAGGENDGLQNLYGTDGTSLFQLFSDTDTVVDWKLQSAYWDLRDVLRTKQAMMFGFEIDVPMQAGTVHFNIDRLFNQPPYFVTQSYDVTVGPNLTWINDAGEVALWMNDSGDIVDWIGSVTGYLMNMQDGSNFGKYLGVTMTSEDVIGTISSVMLRYIYRENE